MPFSILGNMGCIFCGIVSGSIPAYTLYEDAHTLAFLDIHPNNPGHTLVIPKAHAANIYNIAPSDLHTLMDTTQKMARAVKQAMEADGINLSMNNDQAAGQIIFHAHMHVIPRFLHDGYKHWPQHSYPPDEAERITEKIKAAIT